MPTLLMHDEESSTPTPRPRFQFGLGRMLLVLAMLAVMLGALAGLLRPGSPFHLAGGLADDLARGALGDISLAKDEGFTLQVQRDPGEIKAYLGVAVFAPLGVLVIVSLATRAKKFFRSARRMW